MGNARCSQTGIRVPAVRQRSAVRRGTRVVQLLEDKNKRRSHPCGKSRERGALPGGAGPRLFSTTSSSLSSDPPTAPFPRDARWISKVQHPRRRSWHLNRTRFSASSASGTRSPSTHSVCRQAASSIGFELALMQPVPRRAVFDAQSRKRTKSGKGGSAPAPGDAPVGVSVFQFAETVEGRAWADQKERRMLQVRFHLRWYWTTHCLPWASIRPLRRKTASCAARAYQVVSLL